jgi:hypothetical protein
VRRVAVRLTPIALLSRRFTVLLPSVLVARG